MFATVGVHDLLDVAVVRAVGWLGCDGLLPYDRVHVCWRGEEGVIAITNAITVSGYQLPDKTNLALSIHRHRQYVWPQTSDNRELYFLLVLDFSSLNLEI